MANNALLQRTMDRIDKNLEAWNQSSWSTIQLDGMTGIQLRNLLLEDPENPPCGTTGCFAGIAVIFAGYFPIFEVGEGDDEEVSADYCIEVGNNPYQLDGREVWTDYSHAERIATVAKRELDLDAYTAEKLFYYLNTHEQLRDMVAHVMEHGTLEPTFCNACDGDGEVSTPCPYAMCDHEHVDTCEACDGHGTIAY